MSPCHTRPAYAAAAAAVEDVAHHAIAVAQERSVNRLVHDPPLRRDIAAVEHSKVGVVSKARARRVRGEEFEAVNSELKLLHPLAYRRAARLVNVMEGKKGTAVGGGSGGGAIATISAVAELPRNASATTAHAMAVEISTRRHADGRAPIRNVDAPAAQCGAQYSVPLQTPE